LHERVRQSPVLTERRYVDHGRTAVAVCPLCSCEVWLLTWLPGQETDLHDHGLERTVDVHVARVRSKLGDGWVKTIRVIGYRLADDVRVRIDRS
jgi:hypothetical protein